MTPPTELLTRWENDWFNEREHADVLLVNAYAAGAQAGADQELKACEKWLEWNHSDLLSHELHAARRPKPLSLKKQAYAALDAYIYGNPDHGDKQNTYNIIRQALEQLDD